MPEYLIHHPARGFIRSNQITRADVPLSADAIELTATETHRKKAGESVWRPIPTNAPNEREEDFMLWQLVRVCSRDGIYENLHDDVRAVVDRIGRRQ